MAGIVIFAASTLEIKVKFCLFIIPSWLHVKLLNTPRFQCFGFSFPITLIYIPIYDGYNLFSMSETTLKYVVKIIFGFFFICSSAVKDICVYNCNVATECVL